MMGAASTPVFLIVFNGMLVLLVAIPVALLIQAIWGGEWSSVAVQGMLASSLLVSASIGAVLWLRWRRREHRLVDLSAGWLSGRHSGISAGTKAMGLHNLVSRGLPIPTGWLLAPKLLANTTRAARLVSRACNRRGIERIIVRSTFPEEDSERLYPGLFRSVADVDASDVAAVKAAIDTVLGSRTAETVRRYRNRAGIDKGPARAGCVLVQRQVASSITGVLCSFHPERRRPDEITLEAGPPHGERVVDVYSALMERWLSREAPLDGTARRELVDALRIGEELLQGPAVIEFGLSHTGLQLFQLRRAPRVPLLDTWTQSGPVGLNPEPLPTLFAEVVYGTGLTRLEKRLTTSLQSLQLPDAPQPAPRLIMHCGRPLVEYGSLVTALRHAPRRQGLFTLLLNLSREARRVKRRASEPSRREPGKPVDAIRRRARVQARTQEVSERLRSLVSTLESITSQNGDFAPLIPWHRWVRTWAQRREHELEGLRQRLHQELMSDLEELKPSDLPAQAWRHLTLDEWRALRDGRETERLGPRLDERKERFETESSSTVPAALVSEPGATLPALRSPQPWVDATSTVQLRALVRGDASGVVVAAESSQNATDAIVLVPDASLRWLDRVMEARGVLLCGGGQLLSHLALLIMELGIPTLAGLTPEEAGKLVGRRAHIANDELTLDDQE